MHFPGFAIRGRRPRRSVLLRFGALLGLLILVSCRAAPKPAPRGGPPLDVFLSAGDSWWIGTWLPVDSPGSIRASLDMWSKLLGIRRIYWRGQQEEMMLDHGLIRRENLQYFRFFDEWERYLMKQEHLNQVLVEEAHARGMEVYLWAPLFDFGGPADAGGCVEYPYFGQINLTLEHPEWMPVDRYGVRRQNGPIELAYPEARKAVIDMYLRYVLRDKLDGITFFTYAENYGLRFEDEFGYNPPIVDEYQRRHGVDIRTQEFDKHAWRYLRGEYVTQFLRELKAALAPHGKKLGVRLNAREPNATDRWNVPLYFLTAGRIYLDWERWVRERIVDELPINGSSPAELQNRTIDNVLAATRGTGVEASVLTARPFAERFKPYDARGLGRILFATDEASYVGLEVPEQPPEALSGADVYRTMRFLGQVASGASSVPSGAVVPLTRHSHLLVRRMALKALAKLADPASIPALEAALDDPERSVRSAAALALGRVHGPETLGKLAARLRRVREFQFFEATAKALSEFEPATQREIAALARDEDALIRRLAVIVLGRRGEAASAPTLIAALEDADLEVRFRAAHGLQVFKRNPAAVDALLAALRDPEPVVQNRAAVSLAIALVEGSTVAPRYGLESAIRTPSTPCGALPEIALDGVQRRVLDALTVHFRRFGDGPARPDLEWGFRPSGNAILAFGAEGGRRLQAMIDQKQDRRLAELAWQVLRIRQGMEAYCALEGGDEENARIYRTHPRGDLVRTEPLPPNLRYNPLDK